MRTILIAFHCLDLYSDKLFDYREQTLSRFEEAVSRYDSMTSSMLAIEKYLPATAIIRSFNVENETDISKKSLNVLNIDKFFSRIVSYIEKITQILLRIIRITIQLQFIANTIRNRTSRSPTPQKIEPPIGGVKIGGELFGSHVAEELYLFPFGKLRYLTQS